MTDFQEQDTNPKHGKFATMNIRKGDNSDIYRVAEVIRQAYSSVAERFRLTPENCPKHPSNCTPKWIEKDLDRGVEYFVLEHGSEIIGCIALEKANQDLCYLERLAVLPEKRHHGLGRKLFDHFKKEAISRGFEKIGIGIIAKQHDLKSWYEGFGFEETGRKTFAHLPFDVAFLEYRIEN